MIKKPWGSETILECNGKYVLKKIEMKEGHRCSLQYHEKKKETVYVLEGTIIVILNGKDIMMVPGDALTIEPLDIHRMEAINYSVYLEVSTPELDDVVRIEDDYERI